MFELINVVAGFNAHLTMYQLYRVSVPPGEKLSVLTPQRKKHKTQFAVYHFLKKARVSAKSAFSTK
jgi:hypothetical protein